MTLRHPGFTIVGPLEAPPYSPRLQPGTSQRRSSLNQTDSVITRHIMASIQDRLKRDRPPRIQISYEVDTGTGIEQKELPFLMGVLGDFSGHSKDPLPRVRDRKFVEVSRDNFDDVVQSMKPRLQFSVKNTLANDDSKLGVELNFRRLDDFSPAAVAQQVGPLRELLELRQELANLRANLQTNDKLNDLLQDTLASDDKMNALRKELGLTEGGNNG